MVQEQCEPRPISHFRVFDIGPIIALELALSPVESNEIKVILNHCWAAHVYLNLNCLNEFFAPSIQFHTYSDTSGGTSSASSIQDSFIKQFNGEMVLNKVSSCETLPVHLCPVCRAYRYGIIHFIYEKYNH